MQTLEWADEHGARACHFAADQGHLDVTEFLYSEVRTLNRDGKWAAWGSMGRRAACREPLFAFETIIVYEIGVLGFLMVRCLTRAGSRFIRRWTRECDVSPAGGAARPLARESLYR